jgi:hypothetical protein
MTRHDLETPVPRVQADRPVQPVQAVSLHRVNAPARVWMSTVRDYYRRKIRERLARKDETPPR